jgi:Transposase IS116/IS110/IS902 family
MKKRPRRPRKEIAPRQAIPAPRAAKGTKTKLLVYESGAVMAVPGDVSVRPPPTEESVFRLLYRLIEDLSRVRLSHGNRVRQVLPLIPPTITPPRTIPTWEAFFKISAETLAQEEARLLSLATQLLKQDPVGRWLLAQKGVGPALAISILGETWPLTRFKNPGKLWAFGGLDVSHGKGVNKAHPRMTADGEKSYRWNWRLKTRLYLFGVSVVRAGGPWRDLYDQVKAVELEKLGRAQATGDDQDVSPPPGRPQHGIGDQPIYPAPGGAQSSSDALSGSTPAGAHADNDARDSLVPGGAQHASDAQIGPAPAGAHAWIDARTGDAPGGAHDSPDAPTTSAPAGAQEELGAHLEHPPGGAQRPADAHNEAAPAGARHGLDTQMRAAPGGAPTWTALLGAQGIDPPAGTDLEADRAQQDPGAEESLEPVGLRGHAHNRALRKVAKSLLLDLWRVAHDQPPLVGVV